MCSVFLDALLRLQKKKKKVACHNDVLEKDLIKTLDSYAMYDFISL